MKNIYKDVERRIINIGTYSNTRKFYTLKAVTDVRNMAIIIDRHISRLSSIVGNL